MHWTVLVTGGVTTIGVHTAQLAGAWCLTMATVTTSSTNHVQCISLLGMFKSLAMEASHRISHLWTGDRTKAQTTKACTDKYAHVFLPPWRWRRYVPPKRRFKLNGLHGVISHKMILPAGFRWTYFFHPEDGGDMFLRNVGWNSTGYMTLYLTRWYRLPVFAELISSTLKMEAICSSKTSVETQRTTRRHIPQDDTTCRFLLNLFLPPWRWRRYVPPKRRLKLNGLHGVIFQMLLLEFQPTFRRNISPPSSGWKK
jgi:hypothetical protein